MRIETMSIPNIQLNSAENISNIDVSETGREIFKDISNYDNDSQNEFSEKLMEKSIEQANKALEGANRKIERHIHEVTKAVMYKIVDTETKEVIKEFPPEKIQDMIAKMWELAGLFVDERA